MFGVLLEAVADELLNVGVEVRGQPRGLLVEAVEDGPDAAGILVVGVSAGEQFERDNSFQVSPSEAPTQRPDIRLGEHDALQNDLGRQVQGVSVDEHFGFVEKLGELFPDRKVQQLETTLLRNEDVRRVEVLDRLARPAHARYHADQLVDDDFGFLQGNDLIWRFPGQIDLELAR